MQLEYGSLSLVSINSFYMNFSSQLKKISKLYQNHLIFDKLG